jgi:hypothetical protein
MEQPDHFAIMSGVIGRESQRDQDVDPFAITLTQVRETAHDHAMDQALSRVPLEWDGEDVTAVAAEPEFATE